MFADVSSSDYEGRTCPLMRLGYNRDGQRGKTQVVSAVLSAPGGCPVAIQAYPGNPSDPKTQGGFVLHGFLNPPNEITAALNSLPAL